MLLIKENKNLRIDQILVRNKFKRKGVAKTLINYSSNFFLISIRRLLQEHMIIILVQKMYKKMNFKRENIVKNIYHLYPKKYN